MTWAPDYVLPDVLKNYLNIQHNKDDVFIGLWITTVSRNVDDFCGRQFGQTAVEERVYPSVWDRHLRCYVTEVDDLMDTADLIVLDANAAEVTDFTLQPENAAQKGKPYERIQTSVAGPFTISTKWGWTAVPSAVPTGVFLQGARLAARRDSPFGISGSPSEQGEIRLLAQLDPDFRTSLKPLQRDWWAA